MKKIVKGNDFTLRIPVRKIVEGEAVPFPLPACTDIVVNLVNAYRRTALPYSISAEDDSVLEARVESAAFALGAYAVEVRGKMLGASWRSNEYEQLVLVDNNAAADTPLDGTDEGEGSVEMDTAIAIMPPTAELSQLIDEAHEAVTLAGQTADTLAATNKAAKEAESLRATAEQGRVSAENARVEAEKKRVEETDKAVAKVDNLKKTIDTLTERPVIIMTTKEGVELSVDGQNVTIPARKPFQITEGSIIQIVKNGGYIGRFEAPFYKGTPYMDNFFDGCYSLIYLDASDWDMSNVTSMRQCFCNCTSLRYLDLNKWDVSNVTCMYQLFSFCSSLQYVDISCWDVSNVTNMSFFFNKCISLQGLEVRNWDVSKVTNMNGVFKFCSSLKKLDVSPWDVSEVTDMQNMFGYCSSLEILYLGRWNVQKVTTMYAMFRDCSSLTSSLDFMDFDTSSVVDMSYMFYNCTSLKGIWSPKKVQSVTNMSYMFYNCYSMTQFSALHWDTGNVSNMNFMFYNCSSLASLTLNENFGKMKDKVGTLDLSSLSAWTNNTVKSLLTLYDRKANGMGVITIKLHANTKAALGEDGIAQLTAKGYTIA